MNDRTEEAKALREFMKEHRVNEEWLCQTASILKKSNAMFGYLSADTQELLRLLTTHSAVEYAFGCEKIRWGEKNFPGTNAASTYRIKPGYELPDLTEEPEECVITFSGPDIAVHKCSERFGISIPSNSTMSIENRSEKPLMLNAEPQGEQA